MLIAGCFFDNQIVFHLKTWSYFLIVLDIFEEKTLVLCEDALCCEDALRFFHYCFPTHIWVSTAQQQHWCWSFSWLRWRALPTPEGGYHFQISKPNRELPSLGFSQSCYIFFFRDAPPFLQSSSHPGLLPRLAHPGCPATGFSWNVPCRNGSMTLERLHYMTIPFFDG